MKKLGVLLGIALATVLVVLPVKAQDETPGQQATINASIPVGGYTCGRARTYGFSCNVPIDGGGSVYISVNTYYSNGFILFSNVLDLGQSLVTSVSNVVYDTHFRVTSLTVTYTGHTDDGDGDTFTVTGDVHVFVSTMSTIG